MKLTSRALGISESATLAVTRRAAELRSQGIEIVSFGAGEPDFPSPAVAVEAAVEALRSGFTRYTVCAGLPSLRRALAERFRSQYGAPWGAEHVIVTVGAKGGLFEVAQVLFEPGDEVIVPTPAWVSFAEQVRFAGAEPVFVPMNPSDGFRLRPEPLLAAVTERTKGILLNAPCNPTGGVVEERDLARLAEAARDRGFWLLSDETYERFVYDGRSPVSAATLAGRYPEHIVVVGSFSKTYAMTGWRVGFLFGPPQVVAGVNRVQSHATSNVTSFAMVGAEAAIEGAEEDVVAMIAEYEARRDLVIDRLRSIEGFACEPPAGAFYAFPHVAERYRKGEGSVEFSRRLLEEARVAVVPGEAFGADEHIRISFACSRGQLDEGLGRIARALES